MTGHVVDASVVIQRFINESYTPHVRVLFNGILLGDQLYIPEFCLLECCNVFWKQVRFYGLLQSDAEQFIEEFQAIPFQIASISHLLNPALQIGVSHQLAIYDSLYIALALSLGFSLITVDERQAQAAINCGVNLKAIIDFSLS